VTTQNLEFTRIDSDFQSHGTRCSGWLYLPNEVKSPPVVIMAQASPQREHSGSRLLRFSFVDIDTIIRPKVSEIMIVMCAKGSFSVAVGGVLPYRTPRDWVTIRVSTRTSIAY